MTVYCASACAGAQTTPSINTAAASLALISQLIPVLLWQVCNVRHVYVMPAFALSLELSVGDCQGASSPIGCPSPLLIQNTMALLLLV
jgi:hypothetical protein